MVTWLLVALGAAVGAPLRYLVDRAVHRRHDDGLPWGTFAVNVVGSLVLGVLTGAARALPDGVTALLGVGLCGALTTYSTFGYETARLAAGPAPLRAVVNVVASLAAGLAAAGAGLAAGDALAS